MELAGEGEGKVEGAETTSRNGEGVFGTAGDEREGMALGGAVERADEEEKRRAARL